MRLFKKLVGIIYLKIRNAGRQVEKEQYLRDFASCGENVRIGNDCILTPKHISCGSNVVIGSRSCLMASVALIHIGNNVVMGPDVTMRGGDHRFNIIGKYIIDVSEQDKLPENDKDIFIEDDVWIGQGAFIMKGVTIGRGSVIGAGSIVTKSVPPYTIHVGVHAPYEKARFTAEEIRKHEKHLKTDTKEN